MEEYRVIFGRRLRELRKNKKMTTAQLGDMLNVSQVSVCKWELGRNEPEFQDLIRISEIFEVSLDYLFGFDSEKYKNIPIEYETVLFAAKNAEISPETIKKLIDIINSQKISGN